MALPHRRPLAALAVGLLATTVGSLHATGALLGSGRPSPYLLAGGVSGLVVVFAGLATLPVGRTRRIAIGLFVASMAVYVPWLGYALATDVTPVPTRLVGATLTGLLVAAVGATACAGAVLACHRLEFVLGWRESPEKRLLSEQEYARFTRRDDRRESRLGSSER